MVSFTFPRQTPNVPTACITHRQDRMRKTFFETSEFTEWVAALRLIQVFRQNPSGLLEVVGMSASKVTANVGKPETQGDLRS